MSKIKLIIVVVVLLVWCLSLNSLNGIPKKSLYSYHNVTSVSQPAQVSKSQTPSIPSSSSTLAAANAIEALGKSSYGSNFSGVGLSSTNGQPTIQVRLTQLSSSIESRLFAAGQNVSNSSLKTIPITFVRVPLSNAQLEAQQQRFMSILTASQSVLNKDGIFISVFHPDAFSGKEIVQLSKNVPGNAASVINRIFGDTVTLDSNTASPVLYDRATDSGPWNAGDFLTNGTAGHGTVGCTSGWPVHNSGGGQYLITAAHCFPVGTPIYNGLVGADPYGNYGYMSTISNIDLAPSGVDAELLSPVGSDLLWIGPTIGATRSTFYGSPEHAPANYTICTSGAFEGSQCNMTQQWTNAGCIYSNEPVSRYVCGIWYGYDTNSSNQDVGQGDSGGPVYAYYIYQLVPIGIITAGDSSTQCSNWSVQLQGRMCSHNVYYTDLGSILNTWSLTLN